jgi:hypothetical protein
MSATVSPSPIIECFLRELEPGLPADQRSKLSSHEEGISRTTSDVDHARAHRCALWAIEAADDKDASHPRWTQVKELHKLWKDTMFGAEFGLAMPSSSVSEDVRTQWAENAADVVKKLADENGWENSHWEELLTDLIDLEPDQN